MQPATPPARAIVACLLTTSALVSAASFASPAAAQSCSSTPPDVNCIIYMAPGQAGSDGTGESLPDINMTFSPPTAFNGDTNDAGLRWGLLGGAGGNASEHGETGGTGGNGGNLTLTVNPGATIEGSTPEGAINLLTDGGNAGGAMYGLDSMPTAASGGTGGTIEVTLNGTTTASFTDAAVAAQSNGGTGGPGHDGGAGEYAANGGTGGAGQGVTLTQGGSVTNSGGAGITLQSSGGDGYDGGDDNAGILQELGGDGGYGGNAGNVGYTLAAGGSLTASGGFGVSLGSTGGDAGDGGYAYDSDNKIIGKDGGNGGTGGTPGTVTAEIDGTLTVTGTADVGVGAETGIGVLAQSFGGEGGSGGNTDAKIGGSGGGGPGASGNTITISGSGAITTQGSTESPGVLAQSIGGGGGIAGSDSGGGMSVGGDGGNGAGGGAIELSNDLAISTAGRRSSGIVAQSIGGGGGTAGSVSGSSIVFSYIVGGTAGAGGDGSTIDGTLSGTVQTTGQHSSAVTVQSIGGGGGAGGAAMAQTSSAIFGATVSLGGDGGDGGDGQVIGTDAGTRFVNAGVLYTQGSDSHAILAQSIGGGGGVGGASVAETSVYSQETDPPVPNISLSVSVGGTGGSGGAGGNVFLGNSGFVAVEGEGASGLVAQSISGGGGAGGDSKAHSTINGDAQYAIDASLTFGGSGGGGGAPGTADVENSGLVIATGESGMGLVAQTIGAGGGLGGSGDGSAAAKGDSTSATTEITLGGKGGNSGDGGTSNVTNTGGILTLGDGGYGMFAQSIGGGGGKGGGAAGTQNGGTLGFTLNIGGNGGNGGDGGNITATNAGSIATFGADAAAISVQSIGGSGGDGGKAASTLGGSKSTGTGGNGSTQTGFANGLNLGLGDLTQGGGISPNMNVGQLASKKDFSSLLTMGFSLLGEEDTASGDSASDLESLAEDSGDADDDSSVDSFSLSIGVGGAAGAGGSSIGTINVTNTGTIGTVGQSSEGIFAQSIGGGGGKGGAASSSTNSGSANLALGVGGDGGASGSGGTVNVYNTGGSIITTGGMADGIVAQSVGGGGGKGGVAGSKTGLLDGLGISIGGDGGANGDGGAVTVTTTASGGSADGSILTQSHRSIGILAQSIGGGGGIVKALSTDKNNGGGIDPTGDTFDLDLTFGGSGGASGAGESVTVNVGAPITTGGLDSHGVLAQSIGGGGGFVTGPSLDGSDFFGSGTMSGNGSAVSVTTTSTIATSSNGAVGIFAQSVGGGGGTAGDTAHTMQKFGMANTSNSGNGSTVSVTVDQGAAVTTTGSNAPAIIAQSVGGGGGWFTTDNGAFIGSTGGSGTADSVTVTIDGTVDAHGAASSGIIAQSTGGADNGGSGAGGTVNVTVNSTGSVWGGDGFAQDAAAIYVRNAGSGSTVTNYGVVNTHEPGDGYAVYVNAGDVTVTNESGAAMTGNTNLASSNFINNGTYVPLSTVSLGTGTLVNRGTVDLTAGPRVTKLTGNLDQRAGVLRFGADFLAGRADRLDVSGGAQLAGGFVIKPSTLVPGTVRVLTAAGGLDATALADATGSPVFDFAAATGGSALDVTPSAQFLQGGLSGDERSLARHLQRIWDGDHPETLAHGFAALAGIGSPDAYAAALDRLASRQVGAIATARMESSRIFVGNMQSCPVFEGAGLMLAETDCAWGRAITAHLDHDASGDAAGFDTDATLLTFGGQRRIGDEFFLAGAVGWENARLSDDYGASADGDSWMAGLGAKYQSGPLLASATVDLGYGSFDTTRRFSVGGDSFRAEGSPDARNAGLHGRVAYELPFDGFYLRPSLDLDASWISLASYDENGAGDFDLAVEGSDSWVLSATPAVEIGRRVDLKDGTVLRPFASAGMRFVSGNDWTVDARFRNAPDDAGGFSARLDNPNAVATLGAGVTVMTKGNLDLTLQYQGGFADGYTAQSGALKATWRF